MPADDRHHLVVSAGRVERTLDRRPVHAHGRDPSHPGRHRTLDQLRVGRLAGVEMAVGVDHPRLRSGVFGRLDLREERR